jgi:hypothetical protein
MQGRDRHDLVAVELAALRVDGQHAVAVPVERETDLGSMLGDGGGDVLEVGGSAAFVDVAAVGLGRDRDQIGAEPLEDGRCRPVGRTVRAVEDDLAALQVEFEGAGERAKVIVQGALELADSSRGRPGDRTRRDPVLDPCRGGIVELAPVAAEELDPVVPPGVVGGGNDRPEVEAVLADEDRRRRGRQHAAEEDVGSCRRHPGGQRGFEHVAGFAGVADDQDLRPVALDLGGRGTPERERELRRQDLPDRTPDAVGPEQLDSLSHRSGSLPARARDACPARMTKG